MRRIVVLLVCVTLGLLQLGATSAAEQSSRRGGRPVPASYQPPPIVWDTCQDELLQAFEAQCGWLVVPRDYAHPSGPKIRLAVSRTVHQVPDSDYQGVMLVNPGGPGGSGLILSILQGFVAQDAGLAYDWIGFDPRGVGSSVPAISCDPSWIEGDRPPYVPRTPAILHAWVERSRAYADACSRAPGHEVLSHVRTVDTVRDMESLRRALGRDRLNFYGFSYGTYLAQVYMTLFPARVRRFVLDSTVDPTRVWYRSNQDQDVAFERVIRIFFGWLARHRATYGVGGTAGEVERTYYDTVHRLDQHAEQGVLGGDELADVVLVAGYTVSVWTTVAEAYSAYLHTGDASALIDLYHGFVGEPVQGADNINAMYLGTMCTDAPWPRDQRKLNRDNWRLHHEYPFLTWPNAWFNGPCAYWHYRPSRPMHVSGRAVHVPILMIDETFDAATPFSGSLRVRRMFRNASLVEGKNGTTHGASFNGVACIDDTVARYLQDGTVPLRRPGNTSDLVCPSLAQPDPSARDARLRAQGPILPARIREALLRAQVAR